MVCLSVFCRSRRASHLGFGMWCLPVGPIAYYCQPEIFLQGSGMSDQTSCCLQRQDGIVRLGSKPSVLLSSIYPLYTGSLCLDNPSCGVALALKATLPPAGTVTDDAENSIAA